MRLLALALLLFVGLAAAITVNTNSGYDVKRTIPGHQHQGMTFLQNGDLVSLWDNEFCVFPGAVNLPIGQTLSRTNARCGISNVRTTNIATSKGNRVYTVSGYEIDLTTFQGTRRFTDCGQTHGIALDARDGAIFVSSAQSGKVWRVPNPDNAPFTTVDCNNVYFDAGAAGLLNVDGITIGPDGTFYGAGQLAGKLIIVSPWTAASPQGTLIIAKSSVRTQPDGISICVAGGNDYAIVANTGSTISRFALSGTNLYEDTLVAANVGGYLDFTTVDPKGCIWGSTIFGAGQGTYRITNADGTCGCAFPQKPCNTKPEQCMALSQLIRLRSPNQQI